MTGSSNSRDAPRRMVSMYLARVYQAVNGTTIVRAVSVPGQVALTWRGGGRQSMP